MKNLIIISICLLFKYSFAQPYYPFPDTSAFWHSVGFDHGYFQEYSFLFGIHGDTIIDNLTYSKIYRTPDTSFSSGIEYVCALRENNSKQVLIKLPEDPEFILYDFNLNVGDTIFYPTGYVVNQNYWVYYGLNSYRVVQSIDSILLENGEYRRKLNLHYPYIYDKDDNWVEGIGSIGKFGLLYPLVCTFYSNMYNYFFGCFMEMNTIIYFDSTICYNCLGGYIHTSLLESNKKLIENVVYDPLNKTISIHQINELNNCRFEIINQAGKVILSSELQSTTVNVSTLPIGLYFYRIWDKTTIIKTGKVIIT